MERLPQITRRGVQISLGILWILDGILQFQRQMFTINFAKQVIIPAAAGQPRFVSGPITTMVHLVLTHPALFDTGFGVIQIAIGVGLLVRPTIRPALACSMGWAFIVWYLGEGLGGIFGGTATLLTGAPGAALLYGVLAVAAWPPRGTTGKGLQPAMWMPIAWAAVWVGGAILQLLPSQIKDPATSMSLQMSAQDAPAWLTALDNSIVHVIPAQGIGIAFDLATLYIIVGLGVLLRQHWMKMTAIYLGIVISSVYWFVGQNLGDFWSGLATDPSTAPLIVLMGLAVVGTFVRGGTAEQ